MPPNCHKLHPGLAEIVTLDGRTESDIINHIKWSLLRSAVGVTHDLRSDL